MTPDAIHNLGLARKMGLEVLNLTGDPRDEIILWDAHKMYIYTQDRPAPDGPVYHPEKYPEYSASNYRGEFSFAHWDKAGN